MLCPFCQNPVAADAAECPACRLTYPRTCSLVGVVPRLSPGVADTTGSLQRDELAELRRRAVKLESRFPQLVVQVVMHRFPSDHPFTMYVFWLFNAAAFAGEHRRGKHNHAVLLAVDPGRGEAAITPGYGLEPLLPPDRVAHLLELAAPCWHDQRWREGILRVLDGLDQLLESVAELEALPALAAGDF